MKLLIAGSRGIEDYDLSPYVPEETSLIISGRAKGIDLVAERYADRHHIKKQIVKPEYTLYGRSAPLVRNRQMVEMADRVLVIWDGKSRGTQYTVQYAEKQGKPVEVILCVSQTDKK